jgi:F0F1-type ATP synthase assembly protein I
MSEKQEKDAGKNTSQLGVGIGVGLSIGVAIGAAMGNIALGISMGLSLGVAFGLILSSKKKAASDDNKDQIEKED